MKASYVHIPFCKTICTYCDFCKMFYNKKWVNIYLESLSKEIDKNYRGEKLSTLYVGGGTPTALDIFELEQLLIILKKIKLDLNYEYTFEANVECLTLDKIKLLKKYGVNRVSIGIQSIVDKNIKFLGRNHAKEQVIDVIMKLKDNGITNINVDLIYAIPNQTMEDLHEDLEFIKNLNITHVSTYSLIIEPHTKLYLNNTENIDEDLDLEMYNYICNYLKDEGYKHYEISNFAEDGFQSKHNLTYWNNLEYYGFGLGASGYIDGVRYDNTKSFNDYINGNYRLNEEKIDLNTKIENEFILGLRKIDGINKQDFYNKYQINISKLEIVKKLLVDKKIIEDSEKIYINPNYIYTSNNILIEFLGGSYE